MTPVPAWQLKAIGEGRPLEPGIRQAMERLFEVDFSAVRLHEGPAADALGALAFTVGNDIHFAPGRYAAGTHEGLELLGHELTHVVQQRAGRVKNPYGRGVVVVQDPALEAEADRMGRRVADTMQAQTRRVRDGSTVQASSDQSSWEQFKVPALVTGGLVVATGLLYLGYRTWNSYGQGHAMEQALGAITQNLGYVATAYARERLAALDSGAREALIGRVAAASTPIARAYTLVQGLFGGTARTNPSQLQLAGLLNQMGANDTVHGWGTSGTSDPRSDDLGQGDAKLIVHAFTPFARIPASSVPNTLTNYIDNAVVSGVPGKVGVRTCAAYLATAAHPGGTYCLSTSLIGKHHKGTIGPVGLILNVPVWNLILIGPHDLNIENGALGNWSLTKLAGGQQSPRQISENGTQTSLQALEAYSPAQLIAATTSYSELGVMGTCLRGTTPTVTGIFVVVKNGFLCEDPAFMTDDDIDALEDDQQSNNYKLLSQNSFWRGIGQLGTTSMVDRIANSATQHHLPIVVVNNNATTLPVSDIQLTTLTNGGAWANCTVHAF